MVISPRLIRLIGAVLLVFSMTLPISSCTFDCKDKSEPWSGGNQKICVDATTDTVTDYHYVHFPKAADDWHGGLIILAFLWPLIRFLVIDFRYYNHRTTWILALDPIGLGWTTYLIYAVGWCFGHPESGAYVSTLGTALVAAAWLWDAYDRFKSWRARRALAPS